MPMRPTHLSGRLLRVGIIFTFVMAVFHHSTDCFLFSEKLTHKGNTKAYSDTILRRKNAMLIQSSKLPLSKFQLLKMLMGNRHSPKSPPAPHDNSLVPADDRLQLADEMDILVADRWSVGRWLEDRETAADIYEVRKKRSSVLPRPACSFIRHASFALEYARDADYNEVLLHTPTPEERARGLKDQVFDIVTCTPGGNLGAPADCPRCCFGIDRRRYNSDCDTVQTMVPALVHARDDSTPTGWSAHAYMTNISINTSCRCTILP